MTYTTLDKIIRGLLLQKRYPIHFYIDFLIHAYRGFEEMHFDTLGNVQTRKIAVNSYKAIPLPCDFMDWCRVGVAMGQYVKELVPRDSINNLNNFDSNGDRTTYGTDSSDAVQLNSLVGWRNTAFFNENGEALGRRFGMHDYTTDTFKLVRERNEIQLDENQTATHIILEYISDGSEVDNATQVSPYAKSAIEAWINWKMKEHSRAYGDGERDRARRLFEYEHKKLRGRMNPMTVKSIKSSMRRNAHGSIK